jgi:hypothetical protein
MYTIRDQFGRIEPSADAARSQVPFPTLPRKQLAEIPEALRHGIAPPQSRFGRYIHKLELLLRPKFAASQRMRRTMSCRVAEN